MLRRLLLVGLVALVVPSACSRDHGPARWQRMPPLDKVPALRGGGAARSPRIANYKLDAKLDALKHVVTATETLTWTNAGASQVDKLPFHLYPNAFKNERLAVHEEHARRDARRARDRHRLGLDPDRLAADRRRRAREPAQDQHAQAGGIDAPDDQTVAELPLAQPVQPGETIEVNFKFTEQLPEVFARTATRATSIWSASGSRRLACASARPVRSTGSASRFGVQQRVLRRLRRLRRDAVRTEHARRRGDRRARRRERLARRHAHADLSRRGRARLRVDGGPVHDDEVAARRRSRTAAP